MKTNKRTTTPSTYQFSKYLSEEVQPILEAHYSRPQVWVLLGLLNYLEQQRYDFSADRAYQTRPISNAAIADHMKVTERTVRRWMAALERLEILMRVKRKNPHHKYKNLLNRIAFARFRNWLTDKIAKQPDSQCPPNNKDIKISIKHTNKSVKEEERPTFPASGIRYSRIWYDLAMKHLPGGHKRPCINRTAESFRQFLKKTDRPLNHPSVTNSWIKFCQGRYPV